MRALDPVAGQENDWLCVVRVSSDNHLHLPKLVGGCFDWYSGSPFQTKRRQPSPTLKNNQYPSARHITSLALLADHIEERAQSAGVCR